jgi:hypothetical protein
MKAQQIEKKAKFVHDAEGNPVEVVLPYRVYQELMHLKISQEIYNRPETQEAIKQARQDVKEGRVRRFRRWEDAMEWLDT